MPGSFGCRVLGKKIIPVIRKNRVWKQSTCPFVSYNTLSRGLMPTQNASFVKIDADGINAEWIRVPESEESAVLFYLYGGGFIIGPPETHRI
ncbi:MAG: hypothetical protein ACRDBM_02450 [Sporomusa sp.]